jgi:hypothetical protein
VIIDVTRGPASVGPKVPIASRHDSPQDRGDECLVSMLGERSKLGEERMRRVPLSSDAAGRNR